MAVKEGFKPSVDFWTTRFSKALLSTTHPLLKRKTSTQGELVTLEVNAP